MNRQKDISASFLSLYSGCGGMDLGFVNSGYECLGAFDVNKKVIAVHNQNMNGSAVQCDLRAIKSSELMKRGRPDVVIAGPPCQGFSTAGRRDLDDPRNSLLILAGELSLQIQPKVIVVENVLGALSGGHRRYWDSLEKKLSLSGYRTKTIRLNARDLGLAQSRSRAILLAWNTAKELEVPEVCGIDRTVRDVLYGIDGATQHDKKPLKEGSKHFKIAQHIKMGKKLCNVRGGPNSIPAWDIPEVFGETSIEEREVLEWTRCLRRRERIRDRGDADPVLVSSLIREVGESASKIVSSLIKKNYLKNVGDRVDLVNTFNGTYRRLDWDSVSLTVDTNFGNPRYYLHPSENRGFTVREAARFQGFPDSFGFSGNSSDDFRMIGNAVPPPMAEYIADSIKALLD